MSLWPSGPVSGQQAFQSQLLVIAFALAHHIGLIAIDHDFSGAIAAVVVAGHGKAIGTGGANRQQVTAFQ